MVFRSYIGLYFLYENIKDYDLLVSLYYVLHESIKVGI